MTVQSRPFGLLSDSKRQTAFWLGVPRAPEWKSTFGRKLIGAEEIVTGADLAAWANRHIGDRRLRITPRK